jgi:hypothetical protein
MNKDYGISQTTACAIAAARASDAVKMWVAKLTDEQINTVRQRLQKRQEWLAVELLNDVVNRKV